MAIAYGTCPNCKEGKLIADPRQGSGGRVVCSRGCGYVAKR